MRKWDIGRPEGWGAEAARSARSGIRFARSGLGSDVILARGQRIQL